MAPSHLCRRDEQNRAAGHARSGRSAARLRSRGRTRRRHDRARVDGRPYALRPGGADSGAGRLREVAESMRVIWKLRAFVKRDLAIDFSYRLSFALEAVHILVAVAAFYFLAQLVGQQRPGGYASFPFILVGLAVNAYMMTCFVCFSQAIRGGQPAALKAMLAT